MESQIISLNEEMQDIRNKYNELREGNTSKNHLNDDTLMCERHEINSIQSEGYQNRNSQDSYSHQTYHDPNDSEKSITKFLDGQRVTSMFVKNNINVMILKMKQNEKDFQIKIKNMERKIDEWSKSQNVSSEQTDRTKPPPPPQAHTEHVNVVFTGIGKSADTLKIQTLPPIIVEDKPIKTSKKGYHVVETNEYPFREYIPKIPYP
ncbi:hypothetical protein Tco_1021120 [Tanacetum coccineum]